LILAGLYSADGEHEKAIDRYRRVLSVEPDHVIALNDLAYSLAIHHPDAVSEALTFAQRAYGLAPGNPMVGDTLAWVLHLSGDDAGARRVITTSARDAPNNADIQLHAAIIAAAAGAYDVSARQLARAVELNPALAQGADVLQLRATLARADKQ
jgi:tetratricopeptide (TPR) repeat protein